MRGFLSSLVCIGFFRLLSAFAEDDVETCNSHLDSNADNLTHSQVIETHPYKGEIETLVDWVVEEGGFVDDGQAVLSDCDGDDYGVFATRDYSEGELLGMIPMSVIIGPIDYDGEEEIENPEVQLAFAVEDEMFYNVSPYGAYLEQILEGKKQPEFWSQEGKKLLSEVVGNNLPPQAFSDGYDIGGIIFGLESSLGDHRVIEKSEEKAYRIMTQYSIENHMVPLLDLYKHRNGEHLNTYFHFEGGAQGFYIYADRDIKKGEQIFISYNFCNVCDTEQPVDTPALFRDRGFVEQYPQTWTIGENLLFSVEQDGDHLEVHFSGDKTGPTYNDKSFLIDELDRLNKVNDLFSMQAHKNVKATELRYILEYYQSLKTAVELLVNSAEHPSSYAGASNEDLDIVDEDDRYFRENRYTCTDWMPQKNYQKYAADSYASQYQHISFTEDVVRGDKCLSLDGTLQICSGYRPHYHEPFVHFPAVFLSSMRRVVFVGGGDSMLLHEVLKYPSLELVVGLELDQKVVRNSFKHFHTRPHFHDDRVEWWFGDATKSLNIIPKEYFGSFDLVMVDLSETVMSFTVTKNLDMLEALALLTKPDGIFVKNEHYYKKIQTMFDHTTELYLSDNPHICDQHFAMGSNKINFMSPKFANLSDVETLLYKPLQDVNSHFDMMLQYDQNDANDQSKCDNFESDDEELTEDLRPGTLMILNIEQASGAEESIDVIKNRIEDVVKGQGLSVISSIMNENQSSVLVMLNEGFVFARLWKDMKYFAFDIHLWGRFDKNDAIKFALVDVLGSDDWSAYRIVVGGMIGSKTWDYDKTLVGPKIVNNRDCEPTNQDDITNINEINDILMVQIDKKLNNAATTLVLCGDHSANTCHTVEALKKEKKDADTVAFYTCPSTETSETQIVSSVGKISEFLSCGGIEKAFYAALSETSSKIGTVYIDESATPETVQETFEIIGRTSHKRNLLESSILFIAPQLYEVDYLRRSILPDFRKKFYSQQISLVEMRLETDHEKIVSFLAINHEGFLGHTDELKQEIYDTSGLVIEVSSMKGNHVKHQYDFSPHFYKLDDYDQNVGIEQFFNQESVAYQSVFQMKFDGIKMTPGALETIFAKHFETSPEYHIIDIQLFNDDIGDGALVYVLMQEGQVIVTWNGGTRMDINILTYNDELDHKSLFGQKFMKRNNFSLMLLDEQPRGVGRVVNPHKETKEYKGTAQCHDVYFSCREMSKQSLCNIGEKQTWMEENCKASCGYCDQD